ncbi:MAG: hypothetical protein ABIS18_08365 [Actinomycetota bacterium]
MLHKLLGGLGICLLVASTVSAQAGESQWSAVGAKGANVRAIAIDPSNQNNVYAAARNDGVWRSTDRGHTWVQSNAGLDFIAAWSVSVDPSNPKIVWAVTEIGGAYRSSDGGRSWSHTHSGMTDSVDDYPIEVPSQITTDLGGWTDKDPSKANRGGMWGYPIDQCVSEQSQTGPGTRCAGRGDRPPGGYDLKDPDVDPVTTGDQPAPNPYPKVIFHFQFGSDIVAFAGGAIFTGFRAANNSFAGGSFITNNAGSTWEMNLRSADGKPKAGQNKGRSSANIWRVRVATTDANRMYLASTAGVWRSIDGGKTWAGDAPVAVGAASPNPVSSVVGSFFGAGGVEVRGLAVDQTNPDIVYAGTWSDGIHRSVDGAKTFTKTSTGLPEGAGIWDIAVSPINPKNLFAAVYYGGVYQSSDSGQTWSPLNAGFDEDTQRQVYSVAIDKGGSPQNLYAGTINGLWSISSSNFGKSPALASTGTNVWMRVAGVVLLGVGLVIGKMRAGDENRTRA